MEQIPDYLAELKEKQLTQFKNSPNFNAFLKAIATQLDKLETAIFDIKMKRSILTAEGATLSLIGDIVGEKRPLSGVAFEDDEVYQFLILARVIINNSEGTREDILDLLRTLGATSIYMRDDYPASMTINYTGIDPDFLSVVQVKNLVEQGTQPIGINIGYFTEDYFGFDSDPFAKGFGVGEIGASA